MFPIASSARLPERIFQYLIYYGVLSCMLQQFSLVFLYISRNILLFKLRHSGDKPKIISALHISIPNNSIFATITVLPTCVQ
jgi:hypothetical protein